MMAASEIFDVDKTAARTPAKQDVSDHSAEKHDGDDGRQAGVRKIEAAASVWSKWHLIFAFAKSVSCPKNCAPYQNKKITNTWHLEAYG